MTGEKLLEKFSKFCGSLSKMDRVAVLYHVDQDGFCAALIAAKAIEKLRGKKPELVFHQEHGEIAITQKTIKLLRDSKTTRLVTVDLSVDEQPEPIRKIEGFAEILVIDHHKLYKDLNSEKTVFVKPQLLEEKIDSSKYPAAKLCFDLFSRLESLEELRWIACIGILGDMGFGQWKDFFEESFEKSLSSLSETKQLNELVEAVSAMEEERLGELFEEFYNAKCPASLKGSKFWALAKGFFTELNGFLADAEKKAEFFPESGLVWYETKPRHHIKSALVNRLSTEKFPDKTIIVVQDRGESELQISARRQDGKVAMNDLLEKAIEGIKGASAGGHKPAAGGKLPRKALKEFKKKIIWLLKKEVQK